MGRDKDTTTKAGKRHRHLTRRDRDLIEGLRRSGTVRASELARALGVHPSTVRRELKRGRVVNVTPELVPFETYSAEAAQQRACLAGRNKGPRMKLTNAAMDKLRAVMLGEKRSPADALLVLRARGERGLPCAKTVYNAIHQGYAGISMGELPYRLEGKAARKPSAHRRKAFTAQRNTSIEERPAHVEDRTEFGHYEADTVVGKAGTKEVFLTLVERRTRILVMRRISGRTQKAVLRAVRRLLRQGRLPGIKSITFDNGCEFLDQRAIERVLKVKAYYAHPYSSYERGSNENANRILRRFVPKGARIGRIPAAEIRRIEEHINSIHRPVLGGITAAEALERELQSIKAA
jgi:IS30 family transposase